MLERQNHDENVRLPEGKVPLRVGVAVLAVLGALAFGRPDESQVRNSVRLPEPDPEEVVVNAKTVTWQNIVALIQK